MDRSADIPVWSEPTASLPLRWGAHQSRLMVGGALVAASGLLIVQTTAYTTLFGLVGAMLHVVGWSILPATGGRRILAAVLSVTVFFLMLVGPSMAWLAVIPLALWLLARQRPAIAYVLVPIPALAAILALVLFGMWMPRLVLFGWVILVAVGCAWGARAIAVREPARKAGRPKRIDRFRR